MTTLLTRRLAAYKAKACENVEARARVLKNYPNAATSYLDQWPTDWRAVARQETKRRQARRGSDGKAFSAYGFEHCRWIENPESNGLRLVGYADEVKPSMRYTGWHTDDDGCGDVVRGIVYQLPGKNGRARYVAGYADPCNEPAALLAFGSDIIEGDQNASRWVCDDAAQYQAADYADHMAERMAEEEREHNRAYQAGRQAGDALEEAGTMRRELIEALQEHRQERARESQRPKLCAVFRSWVSEQLEAIRDRQALANELKEQFGHIDGFTQ